MSDKEKLRQQLSAYLDGELSDADRAWMKRALRVDKSLARELDELRSVRGMLRDLPREHASEHFVSHVLARAERGHLIGSSSETHQSHGLGWVRWVASAAVVLIVAGICVVIALVLSRPDFNDKMKQIAQGQSAIVMDHESEGEDEYKIKSASRGITSDSLGAAMKPPAAVASRIPAVSDIETDADTTLAAEVTALHEAVPGSEAPADEKRFISASEVTVTAAMPEVEPVKPAAMRRSAGLEVSELSTRAATKPSFTDGGRLAMGSSGGGFAEAGAAVRRTEPHNVVLFTDDLPDTRREVERVLFANGLVAMRDDDSASPAAGKYALAERIQPGGQMQMVAYVTREQLKIVTVELIRVRSRQVVSQAITAPTQLGRRFEEIQQVAYPVSAAKQVLAKSHASGKDDAAKAKAYVAIVDTPRGLKLKDRQDATRAIRGAKKNQPTLLASPSAKGKSGPSTQPWSAPSVENYVQASIAPTPVEPLLITLNWRSAGEAASQPATQDAGEKSEK